MPNNEQPKHTKLVKKETRRDGELGTVGKSTGVNILGKDYEFTHFMYYK